MSKVNIRSVKTLLTESYTITNQEIRLNEAADLGEPITIPGFTRVYTTPNAGQFQVLTFEEDGIQYGGKIIFNSVDEGKSVSVTYYGWGSIIWAEDFNNHETRISQNETTITNHESRITTLENDLQTSSYSTPTEETAQVIHLPVNTVKGQISGSVKGRTYTNLLGNDGDFEVDSDANGLADGWSYTASNAVALDTDSIFGNKSQKMTSYNDGSSVFSNYLHHKINFNVDDKIYISLYAKYSTLDYNPKIQMFLRDGLIGSSLSSIPSFTVSNANYTKYSTILQATAIASNQGILIRDGHDATTTSFDRWIDGVLAVNLTQLFGAGNEPTLEECDQMFHFINGTKSTLNTRLRSVGKNLFDEKNLDDAVEIRIKAIWNGEKIILDNSSNTATRAEARKTIYLKNGQTYVFSKHNESIISGSPVSAQLTYKGTTFNALPISFGQSFIMTLPSGYYDIVAFTVKDSLQHIEVNLQFEQGTTATSYEPYKESVVYLNETLRRLPNGVSDEVDVDEGKLIKKIDEQVLDYSGETWSSNTTGENVDKYWVEAKTLNADGLGGNTATGDFIVDNTGKVWQKGNYTDSVNNIGKFYYGTNNTIIFVVAKDAGQPNITSITLIYQLAEPIPKDLSIAPVQCFENGTLYVEQTVRDSGIYSGGLSVTNTNLPIDSLEKVYKIEGNTKIPVDLADCTVAGDGLSFTVSGAIDGEKYEFIYSYPGELGTIPEIEYSVPLNRSAQIDGNTNMINQLSKELGDLWTTLLPLADKELAMALIGDVTTDMSTDAFANELKNKINEILNVW